MLVNKQKFTIGADPEVFVKQDGNFISAHDLVPGTKVDPFIVDKGAVQVDGMALEFNIDPASSYQEFQTNLDVVQETLKGMIGDREFLDKASVMFDDDFTKDIPPLNLILGCDADYNAWTMEENPTPDASSNMRTAGGHIHIGGIPSEDPFDPSHFDLCARLARILDYTLGTYSVLWDKDDQRRSMYGKAGSFRPKEYGMEYRTLSNQWLFDKNVTKFVYDSIERALKLMFNPMFEPSSKFRDIINNSDRTSNFFNDNEYVKQLGV